MSNLWILGEEALRAKSFKHIIDEAMGVEINENDIEIKPVVTPDNKFSWIYKISGFDIPGVGSIRYEIVSGTENFIDYLVYKQDTRPTVTDTPILLVEDNKSRPSDAGNMHKQRQIKFYNASLHYPNVPMLYLNIVPDFKKSEGVSPAYLKSTRVYNTLGVKVKLVDFSGEDRSPEWNPYTSLKEMVEDNPVKFRKGTTPTGLKLENNTLTISTKLLKGKNDLADPGVGFVGGASLAARKLGFKGDINVINHQKPTSWLSKPRKSKLAKASEMLNISFDIGNAKMQMEYSGNAEDYWTRKTTGEKHATILQDVMLRNQGYEVIYDNHAGTERGWFVTPQGDHLAVKKDIGGIPDLVVINEKTKQILVIEGEMYENANKGVAQFTTFIGFDRELREYYPDYDVKYHLTLNGGHDTKENVLLHLQENGTIVENWSAKGYAI